MLTEKRIEDIVTSFVGQQPALAYAIFEEMQEGLVFATVHAELQFEDGQAWVDLGPLDYFGPIAVPPDMKGGEQLNVIVRRVRNGEENGD